MKATIDTPKRGLPLAATPLFGKIDDEIRRLRRLAAEYTAQAEKLDHIVNLACGDGVWTNVRAVTLEVGKHYVVRRPESNKHELAEWQRGWWPVFGRIEPGVDLEVLMPNASDHPTASE